MDINKTIELSRNDLTLIINVMKFQKGHKINKGRIPWNKGLKMLDDVKRKISNRKKGKPAWNKGKKCYWVSERNRILNKLKTGDKHWNWKGGITDERDLLMGRQEYKQWRSDVFQRDNWTCQTCGKRSVPLEAHHIKRWKDYPELRFDIDNGVTLCVPCHKLTFKIK